MDLSINSIKNVKSFNKLNFKGVKGEFSKDNKPVFTFNPPPYDPYSEKVTLEFIPLDYDIKQNKLIQPSSEDAYEADFDNDKYVLSQDDLSYDINNKSYRYKGFAYRYKISSLANPEDVRYIVDSFEKIKTYDTEEEFAVIKTNGDYKIEPKKGAMRHSFLDADAILNAQGELDKSDKHTPRNHFNKLGGSTKGLIELLKSGELDPYRYVISTPDIGNDVTSSHGYWPNNLYQTKDMDAFKDLIFELFKKGKGYVADGAFTSQSLQSPLFQHVLKWGELSPYYNMFKLDGGGEIALGILPDELIENREDNEASKHIGIRIVNNPNDRKNYDETKPILFQLYDDRLSSEKQRNDSTKLIDKYDTNPKDIFEITDNNDSVYPFYFEVDPSIYKSSGAKKDFRKKIDLFRDKNSMSIDEIDKKMGKEDFLNFGHFKITTRNNASGAAYWDGNRDIVKLNLSNPSNYGSEGYGSDNIIGMQNAREYLYGVARFYTEGIQSDLLKRTAQLPKTKRAEIAKKNGIENFDAILATQNDTNYPILERNKKIGKYIDEFPLQSLETSPELSAVFAQPGFNESLFMEDDFYVVLKKHVQDVINGAMINLSENKIGNKEEYKTYVKKAYTNEILKYIYAQTLNSKAANKNGTVNLEELKKVTLKSLAPNAKSPKEEKDMVIGAIKNGIKDINLAPIKEKIAKELNHISLSDFKETESLIMQSNAGLNWRFDAAKDIGDLDSPRNEIKNFKDLWDGENGVVGFWRNFIKEAKEYNPSSYIIAELTDMWGFYNNNDEKVKYAFDDNKINPDEKEKNFLNEINATTNSNYGQYFNKLSCFLGVNPENAYDDDNDPVGRAGNLGKLKEAINKFIQNSQPQSALLTHEFFDNHDKPRLMHCLPLNMQLYLCGTNNLQENLNNYIEKLPEDERGDFMEKVIKLTGRDDFSEINPMALAVGFMMNDTIDKLENYNDNEKNALKGALRELVNGQKTKNSIYNYKRAQSFGTKPYEFTIREMFKRAGSTNNLDEKVKNFHSVMMKPSMDYIERLWQVMNAIVGTPTLFNGTEFAQTGYETRNKNVFVNNRNQILHGLKDDPRYKGLYDKISADANLSQQPQMSAIRDGFPVVCEVNSPKFDFQDESQGALDYFLSQIASHGGFSEVDKLFANGQSPDDATIEQMFEISPDYDNHNTFRRCYNSGILKRYADFKENSKKEISLLPIFKYDDKGSKVLSIITNNGVPHGEYAYKSEGRANLDPDYKVRAIELRDDSNQSPLPEGTELKKKIYNPKQGKYVTEKNAQARDIIYTIKNNKLVRKDGKEIELNDTVVNFFVDRTPKYL